MNIYICENCNCEDCKCEKCGKTLLELKKCECGCDCSNECNCEDCNCENCNCNMELLKPQTADMTLEKHVPVVNIDGENVEVVVGSTPHPMEEKHYIEYIILETEKGMYVRYLNPGEEPKANFTIQKDEKITAVYEYCNIHGLWKNEMN